MLLRCRMLSFSHIAYILCTYLTQSEEPCIRTSLAVSFCSYGLSSVLTDQSGANGAGRDPHPALELSCAAGGMAHSPPWSCCTHKGCAHVR